jgi:hypothetical protein
MLKVERLAKLRKLAEAYGHDTIEELLEMAALDDTIAPGICIKAYCNYTCECDPTETEGFCENCDTLTVQSALVLAGKI